MIVLVSGRRGSGKTTFCRHLVRDLAGRGFHPGGILGTGIFDDDGRKTGVYAESAVTGERRVLAEIRDPAAGTGGNGDRRIGRYSFFDGTFQWAVGVLRKDIREDRRPVIIDEIGPLEIEKHGGYYPVLAECRENPPTFLVAVVRPELIPAVRGLFVSEKSPVYNLDDLGSGFIRTQILELLSDA